jgi:peptidyl-prolyl cis-trans isomerase SurA
VRKSVLFCMVWGVLLGAFQPVFAGVHDGIAAIVDDEIITLGTLDETMVVARARAEMAGTPIKDEVAFKKQVLDMLVVKQLQLQQAKKHGLAVTEKEVQDAIGRIKNDQGMDDAKFKQALANDHLSYSAFKQSIEEQLIIQKLVHTAVGHDIVVTDSEVARAKKQVAQASRRYKVMDYRLAVGDGAGKQSLKAMQGLSKRLQEKGVVADQLLKASAFRGVEGQSMGERLLSQLPSVFADVVAKMKAGQVSAPIKAANGYHVLVLEAITGGLDDTQIRQRLFMRHVDEKRREWLQQLRALTYVKLLV